MRVLCLTNMYPTADEPAAGSFVRDQVDDLRELGVDVEVLSFDGRVHSAEYARAARRLRTRLRERPPDVIHAHYGLTGAITLAQRRVPVVTTFHGSDVGYVRWQVPISWVVARATTPIFVARIHAERIGLPDAEVIPAGVSSASFEIRPRGEARRRLGWPEDGTFVLLPGSRSNPVKGAATFDAVVAELDGVDGVELRGFSRSQVVDVLNASNALLVTSASEGSPVTVKEALACGTPVVTVRVGDVPQVVGGLPGCAVCDRDVAALTAAVREAVASTDRTALRARAREYERVELARRVVRVYESVLS